MGESGERRGGAGQRVHFEALVAVGGAAGDAGFEAESVDVSPEGMRLRAAHLPELGDRLLCRFDGPGGEVVAEGEVCWRNEEARGGEFGLRFSGLDAEAEEAVRAMCSALAAPAEPAEREAGKPAAPAADRGARVRLHIEGLGSPMKARVRGGGVDNVEVGSNLEFLKVGRSLEIEDVDKGSRREVYIDEVKVEVDPSTSIPQLVVTLRHDAMAAPRAARAARAGTGTAAAAAAGTAAAAGMAAAAGTGTAAGTGSRSGAAPAARAGTDCGDAERTARSAEEPVVDDAAADADDNELSPALEAREPEAEGSPEPVEARPSAAGVAGGLRSFGGKAARVGAAVAGKLGPALSGAGSRMKGAMAGLVARVKQRRAERAAEGHSSKPAGPRRMTAPPPTGALRADGRRLVRDEEGEEISEAPPPAKPAVNKKAAALGSFLGLAAVLAIFGVARFMGLHGGATAEAPAPNALPSDTSAPAAPGAADAPGAQPAAGEQPGAPGAQAGVPGAQPGGPMAANVPLFGATPLSTTEPVPPPAPPGDPAAPSAQDPLAAAANAAANGAPPGMPGAEPAAGGAEEPSLGDSDDSDGDPKSWGQGTVKNPVVLKLKMDGAIEALNGASGPMGFTVSLPDRRSLSSGSDLARKDKRIASLRVVNTPQGAEVTVQFKDGVPAYLAKANGNRLEIALGNEEGHKKVAAKSKKGKKPAKDEKSKKPQKKGGKDKKHGH